MSEKFEATKNLLNGTSKNPSPDSEVSDVSKKSSYHKTPKKKLKASAATTVDDISICQLRTIVFESKEDISIYSPWINCSRNFCNWWVYSRCVGKFVTFVLFQFN